MATKEQKKLKRQYTAASEASTDTSSFVQGGGFGFAPITSSRRTTLTPSTPPPSAATATTDMNADENNFVNHGLKHWEASRAEWVRHTNANNRRNINNPNNSNSDDSTSTNTSSTPIKASVPVDTDEIIDIIFSQRWRTNINTKKKGCKFPSPVPLTQMVDILVDLWEAEDS